MTYYITMTKAQVREARKQTIEDGANSLWQWVNSLYDGEDIEHAKEIINNYTVEDVLEDAEEAALNCWVVANRRPLTKFERNWVKKLAIALIADAQAEAARY